ncbi:MAG TPA: hypothetical protein VLQ66_05035, partial [Paenisporosarcina sp.]|nr:hypothetical protein [Paenisporosarcina sp.]
MSVIPKFFLLAMFFCSMILFVFFTSSSASYHHLLSENKGEYSLFLMWGEEEGTEGTGGHFIETPEA